MGAGPPSLVSGRGGTIPSVPFRRASPSMERTEEQGERGSGGAKGDMNDGVKSELVNTVGAQVTSCD